MRKKGSCDAKRPGRGSQIACRSRVKCEGLRAQMEAGTRPIDWSSKAPHPPSLRVSHILHPNFPRLCGGGGAGGGSVFPAMLVNRVCVVLKDSANELAVQRVV